MCKECVGKLSRAFTFRKQCWEADTILKSGNVKEELDYEDIIEELDLKNGEYDSEQVVEMIGDYEIEECVADSGENVTEIELLGSEVDIEAGEYIIDEIHQTVELEEHQNETEEHLMPLNISETSEIDKPIMKNNLACPYCGLVLQSRGKYRYHINTVHDPNYKTELLRKQKGSYTCKECGKNYDNITPFKRHLKLHDPNNPNRCHICGRVLSAPSLLETHLLTHTDDKPFQCEICGKKVLTKTDLNTHMRFHTGERPYKCSMCYKAFITVSHWRSHELTHIPNQSYECEICKKQFKSKRVLQQHARLHQEDKHIKCNYCDQKFATSKHITAHLKSHPEFIPFECEVCGKKFSIKNSLETHLRIHHSSLEVIVKTE